MDDFFRQNLASLSGSASKVLWALVLEPGGAKSELMRLSGVTDRGTFYRSWNQLQELGLLQNPTAYVAKPYQVLQIPTIDAAKPDQGVLQNPTRYVAEPDQGVLQNPTDDSREMQHELQNPTDDLQAVLAWADALDASGDERRPNSPFQIRRKQQLSLIQKAWTDTFGQQLTELSAKELLQLAHSQAVDVYQAMEAAAQHTAKYPFSYVKTILTGLAKKPATQQAQQDRESEETGLGLNRPVTAEMRKSWDEAEALLQKSGLLDGWAF